MEEKTRDDQSIQLMSNDRIRRSLKRMSFQIAEDNRGDTDIVLYGLKERGYIVAQQLGRYLDSVTDTGVRVVQLGQSDRPDVPFKNSVLDSNGQARPYAIVVDDVIFSGQTMLAALGEILQQVDIEIVRTAALVDRGHRTMPVEATFTGLELPTKLDEHVEVRTEGASLANVMLHKSGR